MFLFLIFIINVSQENIVIKSKGRQQADVVN